MLLPTRIDYFWFITPAGYVNVPNISITKQESRQARKSLQHSRQFTCGILQLIIQSQRHVGNLYKLLWGKCRVKDNMQKYFQCPPLFHHQRSTHSVLFTPFILIQVNNLQYQTRYCLLGKQFRTHDMQRVSSYPCRLLNE